MAELDPCPTCGVPMPDGDCESCYPTLDNKPLTPAILKRVIDVAYQFENEVQSFDVAMQQSAFLHNWAAPAIVKLNELANQYRTLYYEQNKQADQQP